MLPWKELKTLLHSIQRKFDHLISQYKLIYTLLTLPPNTYLYSIYPFTTSHSIQVYFHSIKIHVTLLQCPHISLLPLFLTLNVYLTPSNINYEYGLTLDCINIVHYILADRQMIPNHRYQKTITILYCPSLSPILPLLC